MKAYLHIGTRFVNRFTKKKIKKKIQPYGSENFEEARQQTFHVPNKALYYEMKELQEIG